MFQFYSNRYLLTYYLILSINGLLSSERSDISRSKRDVYYPGRYSFGKSRGLACDTTLTKKEGWIYSPNFPLNYENGITCTYNIIKYSTDVCSIEITLTDFDLENTPQCTADYFDLGNGEKLCGVLIADTRKKIMFSENSNVLKMTLHTDANNNRKGFMAQIRQLRNSCSAHPSRDSSNIRPVSYPKPIEPFHRQPIYLSSFCDIYIGDVAGDLRSPGFPYGYDSNQTCVYSVRRAATDICKVELIIHQFDISSNGRHCDSDFFELPDKTLLCGKVPFQKRIYSYSTSSDLLIMQFKSDSYKEKGVIGFWIEVRQIRNSCDLKTPRNSIKCDQTITRQITKVESPNFPRFYEPKQFCVYLVEPLNRNTCEYELDISSFNVQTTRDDIQKCSKDFMQLPDGSRICGYISGKRTFHFPKYRDRIGMFYFTSDDSVEESGYQITVNQIPNSCSHLHNHNYDYNNHNDRREYGFTSRPNYIQNIQTYHSTTVRPFISENSIRNCDKTTNRNIDMLTSPEFPYNYPLNTRCIYSIERSSQSVCQIKAEILNLDLEHTNGCNSDYLMIETTGERLCGKIEQFETKYIDFPKYQPLRLIFNSDQQTSRPGFQLRIEQIPNSCQSPGPIVNPDYKPDIYPDYKPVIPSTGGSKPNTQICDSCSAIVSVIKSHNYPLPYESNTDCVYKVLRASGKVCRLEIYFEDFDVGFEDFTNKICSNDYLEIQDMRYCGRRKGEKFEVKFPPERDEMNLRFHSDSTVRHGGFRIQIRQLDDQCRPSVKHEFSPGSTESCHRQTFSEKSLQILSPHYESGSYQQFLNCEYIIKKMSSDVCALEVQFDAFSIEDSKSCYKDYLQIGSVKLCGKLPYKAIRTFEFLTDELVIRFHTDSEGSGAGFAILVKQIQC